MSSLRSTSYWSVPVVPPDFDPDPIKSSRTVKRGTVGRGRLLRGKILDREEVRGR